MANFVKLPEKKVGATATVNGHAVVCKDFPYNGQSQLKWVYAENDAPVYRKINGTIQVVEPNFKSDDGKTASPKDSVQVNFPELNTTFEESYKQAVELENQFTALAVKIAKGRYPSLSENSGTFGMIVNAIKTHLISLR